MTQRYPGGFVTKTPPTLNPALGNSTPGVWTLDQVMQNIKAGTWPAYDPYFEYTTLLLHGNGTNGAQNNTFLDSSTNNFTVTRNGNTTQGTFTPYGSNWSNNFGGSTNYYLTIPSGQTPLNLSTGDFTVECWVNITDISQYALVLTVGASAWQLGYEPSRKLFVYNGGNIMTSSTAITVGTWNHFAWTRSGTTMYLYLNGVQVATASNSSSVDLNGAYIAAYAGGTSSYPFYGSMSNLRIVKGTAVYTSAFTPPTGPLTAITNTSLLTCQSNRFIDNSSNAFAITVTGSPSVQRFSPFNPSAPYAAGTIGGSGYFDGSGDTLSIADNSAFYLNGYEWTMEVWAYPTAFGAYRTFLAHRTIANAGWSFSMTPSGTFGIYSSSGGSTYASEPVALTLNAWNHVAITRTSDSTTRHYLNGVLVYTGSTNLADVSDQITIGASNSAAGEIFQGLLSDVRLVKGSALYTGSTLTVPTAPLTAVSGTSVLTNFTNGGIIDNAMMNDLETVGNAQISTTQSKFGGSSIQIPSGGTSWLIFPANTLVDFGTGDFTIECWVNFSSTATTYQTIIQIGDAATTSGFHLLANTNTICLRTNNSQPLTTTGTVTANTWSHVAISRSSGTTRLFIDGVTSGGTYSWTASLSSGTTRRIGADIYGNPMTGYIDDLRITKGYARYTANFTPQTSQWQDQ